MMKSYPSIPKKYTGDSTSFYVFDKLDGSNIRAEWTKKKGFDKFGTRKQLLSLEQGELYFAKPLIENLEEEFNSIFSSKKLDKVVCFFEFYGTKTFAGMHEKNDTFEVVLIDIDIYKKGILEPKEFIKWFENSKIKIPKLIHHGVVDFEFHEAIRNSQIPEVSFEGVVCKTYNQRKKNVDMFKIKSDAWLKKVSEKFANNPKLLQEVI